MAAITACEASVKTVTVEVKALKVDKKQFTIAMFKQLPYRYPFDDAGNLLGNVWGYVNYHWSGCAAVDYWGYEHAHANVIWQCGDELYWANLYIPSFRSKNEEDPEARHRALVATLDQLYIAV